MTTRSIHAHSVGYKYGFAIHGTVAIVYKYGVDYEKASRGCLGSFWLLGDDAIDLESELESIVANEQFDECEQIDLLLSAYDDLLEPDAHSRCSSDGMLVWPNIP